MFVPCFYCEVPCVISSFAIILMGKIELVDLLSLSAWCLVTVIVLQLFLAVPWVGLRCMIVVFADHTNFFSKCTMLFFQDKPDVRCLNA